MRTKEKFNEEMHMVKRAMCYYQQHENDKKMNGVMLTTRELHEEIHTMEFCFKFLLN
jgi:hypothetical protein